MANLHPSSFQIAITWCLAWGHQPTPQYPISQFKRWRSAIAQGDTPTDPEWQQALDQAGTLTQLGENSDPLSIADITELVAQHPALWQSSIGLVYGGVTKVKSYVFESVDLQEVRGASALLDRINLVDLPAFFHAEDSQPATHKQFEQCQQAPQYCQKVRAEALPKALDSRTSITDALIPELIIYATGGNILAFCPTAFIPDLCNAIEKRYTTETLCANSCAVGEPFRLLEIYLGLLKDPIETTLWHDTIATQHKSNKAIQAYFGFADNASAGDIQTAFNQRKNFGELVGKLTSLFNQRRSGCDALAREGEGQARLSRRYPPMFETHPYLMRDDSDIRSFVTKADGLPDEPKLSEPTVRKRRVGQITKRDELGDTWYKNWYARAGCKEKDRWQPEPTEDSKDGTIFKSWVSKFEEYLKKEQRISGYDTDGHLFNEHGSIKSICKDTREARSLSEIGASSNGYVAYIYADGNSMGQFIREQIKTPTQYQQFSEDVFAATEQSVYRAIADHITPYEYKPDAKSPRKNKAPVWIHPFEIITIGGDDVLLIVPANKAVEVAQAIGESFEELLLSKGERYAGERLSSHEQKKQVHRYLPATASNSICKLSTSSGVLITAADTPIYYADKLVSQLLKSAKKHLKSLKKYGYHGGTVDFLVLKAVTMITSDIEAFRKEGLTIDTGPQKPTLQLYAAPYTLHELSGLVETVRAFKQAKFPRSQLYQIRSLLERGKRTAILNYRYFRVRLEADKRQLIEDAFEKAWCEAQTNSGNLAPWLTAKTIAGKTTYETIWRELVELEPFIETEKEETEKENAMPSAQRKVPSQEQSTGRAS
ncbi:MAG: type III-B CRISPR-associated protein Cas10/Cmr2 [Phormidesmis sp.]